VTHMVFVAGMGRKWR